MLLFEKPVFIQEESLIVKNLMNEEEKIQAYHLRHRVFCQELGWVPQSEDVLEIDKYDDGAIFFGIFDKQNKLLAFLRLIVPEGPFMLEKEFSSLIEINHKIRKEYDTVEVSRLCIAPEARNEIISSNLGIHNISMLLYKGVYHWCIRNNIRYLYLVVEYKIYRLLKAKGFPCKPIGEPQTMHDGVIAVAAMMDWKEFEMLNAVKRPRMLRWFNQYQSIPAQRLLKQPNFSLQRQAFA